MAERCESMLSKFVIHSAYYFINLQIIGHMREHTIYLPDVEGLDAFFDPVLELVDQIVIFLKEVQNMSWVNRRLLEKQDLAKRATYYTERVDDVNCQVIVQLNIIASQNRMEPTPIVPSLNQVSTDVQQVKSRRRNLKANYDIRIVYLCLVFVTTVIIAYCYRMDIFR